MTSYLLDTDVLSVLMADKARKRRQNIAAWLRSIEGDKVILSSVSIAEINRGIALLHNSIAAAAIKNALEQVVATYSDLVVTPSHAEWQEFARLSAVPDLRGLCHGRNRNNQARTGADVFLAVQAATTGYAVATCNIRDFVLIDRHLPLCGGVVDAASGSWVRAPDAIGTPLH